MRFDMQLHKVFITIFVVFLLITLQRFFLRYLSSKKWESEKLYLKIHTYVRNLFLILVTLAIIIIWIPQIQSFAISIAAIAVAVVVSLKEIITMFTGGLIRSSTDLFNTGDRIEVNSIKGDVIRVGFFTTELLEVEECGQRTGRTIHVPNNFSLTSPLLNESSLDEFCFHVLTLPIPVYQYSEDLKETLLDFVKTALELYVDNSSKKCRPSFKKVGSQA